MNIHPRRLAPLIVTLSAVAIAIVVKFWVFHWLGSTSPFLLLFSAVLVASWYGGFRQGVLATCLGVIFSIGFYMDGDALEHGLSAQDLSRVAMYAVDCLFISAVCSALRQSKEKSAWALRDMRSAQHSMLVSETRFRRVYDSNMIGLIFFDRAGRIHEANNYFLEMVGFDREDLARGLITRDRLTPAEHMPRTMTGVDQLARTRRMLPYEKEYIAKNGERVPVLLGAASIDDEMSVCFVLDMRARKKAERALEDAYGQLEERVVQRTQELQEANRALKRLIESEEASAEEMRQSQSFLDSVIDNIPNMLFVKDAKTLSFVRFNKAGEALLGFPREEMIGKSDADFFPPNQVKFFNERDRDVLKNKSSITIEEETIKTVKGERFLRTTKLPILDRDGNPRYILGISEDITERKNADLQKLHLLQATAAREEAEKTARRLAFLAEASAALTEGLDTETMLDGFARVVVREFADWCLIDLTPEAERVGPHSVVMHRDPMLLDDLREYRRLYPVDRSVPFGPGHVMRTGKAEFHSPIDLPRLRTFRPQTDYAERVEKLGLRSLMVVPLRSYGRILGAITFALAKEGRLYDEFDVSVAHDLAKRVSDGLENARLYARAQEASRAKSAFLANMSHEIRTPLGAMIGFAEILAEGDNLSEDQLNSSATIVRNGRQLLRIVDEILDLSKVESEQIQIESVSFPLPRLLREVSELLGLKAQEKGLEFRVQEPPDLPALVVTDPTRLRQILINVIGNAIKFTESGSVHADVTLNPSKGGMRHRTLEVKVTDTGIGIDRSQEGRLFQPFAQADESTTRRFGGTGLGLFLSRRLARLLGGDLVLDHDFAGPGSRFVLRIDVEIPPEIAYERKHVKADTVSAGGGDKGKVLIVDDAPDNRALIGRYISRMGYEVDTAENGTEGVAKARAGDYAVVLMDVQMPELDGFAAVKILKENQYSRPVIALTAHAMKGDRERCIEGGFDDYLSKPIDRDQLREKLERFARPPEAPAGMPVPAR